MLCQEILKELKCIERIRDHKVIDIWLLMLIYMNGESLQKSVEKIFKKKIIEGCIHEAMVDQCIGGNMELVQVCISFIHLEKKNFFVVDHMSKRPRLTDVARRKETFKINGIMAVVLLLSGI